MCAALFCFRMLFGLGSSCRISAVLQNWQNERDLKQVVRSCTGCSSVSFDDPFQWGWTGSFKGSDPCAEQYTHEPDRSERLDIARFFSQCSQAKATTHGTRTLCDLTAHCKSNVFLTQGKLMIFIKDSFGAPEGGIRLRARTSGCSWRP